jgi:phenylacetate-CoA ligase
LPPTTKADVAASFPDGLVSSKPVHEPWKYSASSGTINRITVVQDFRKRDFTRATQLHALRVTGYRAGMKYLEIPPSVCANVCGVGATVEPNVFKYAFEVLFRGTVFNAEVASNLRGFAERQLLYRRLELPSFGPEGLAQPDASLDAYLQQIDKYRPHVVKALPVYLYLLALRIEETGTRPQIDGGVMPMGSVMTPHMKRVVERAFGCPVYEDYGSTEFGCMAVECGRQDGLHPFNDLFLLEIVRNGRPAPAGAMGRLLVTDLWNYAMPLIRYDIGDVASFRSDPCGCGRAGHRLAIHGRLEDSLVAEDGSLLTSDRVIDAILSHHPGVLGFRIDQRRDTELEIQVVPRKGHSLHLDDVGECLADLLGRSIRIVTRTAGTILPEPNGKYRFVRNFTKAPLAALPSASHPC